MRKKSSSLYQRSVPTQAQAQVQSQPVGPVVPVPLELLLSSVLLFTLASPQLESFQALSFPLVQKKALPAQKEK